MNYNCLIESSAWLLDIEPGVLSQEIGYTGLELTDHGMRGIHIQEILPSFIRRNYGLMILESQPRLGPNGMKVPSILFDYLFEFDGLIFGESLRHIPHVYGYYEGKVFDPLNLIDQVNLIPSIDLFACMIRL